MISHKRTGNRFIDRNRDPILFLGETDLNLCFESKLFVFNKVFLTGGHTVLLKCIISELGITSLMSSLPSRDNTVMI